MLELLEKKQPEVENTVAEKVSLSSMDSASSSIAACLPKLAPCQL